MNYQLNHLKELESESIFILREVAAQFEIPVLMFSGGKDSILMVHLAQKAFYPARIPFPLLHVDTGHNFPETIKFRDDMVAKLGARLIVGSVDEAIKSGMVTEESGVNASRNGLQTAVLLDELEEPEEMKKRQEPRNVSFRTVMNLVSGTLRIRGLNYGIFLMVRKSLASTLEYSPFQTGRNWTYGNILLWKK
jgi:hypothetical protein